MQLSAQPLALLSSLRLFLFYPSILPPTLLLILQASTSCHIHPSSCHFCVSRPYLLSHLLALCPSPISPSVSFYLFFSPTVRLSPLHLLFFIPHLALPSVFLGFFFLNIDFRSFRVFHSLSLSGPVIAPIYFGAYEMMLPSSSSNFLTLSLFPPVPVPPAGGRGGSVLDGKKNKEERWVKALQSK